MNFTKEDIQKRFDKSLIKPKVEVIDINDRKSGYNKILKIIIPGKPIVDKRPRGTMNMETGIGHFYNPQKANLKKIFSVIYKDSILENICIMSPMKIFIKAYVSIPTKYFKAFNKNQKEQLLKENMGATTKPDNDNLEKVHYDVLQDAQYMVILRDEAITESNTRKIFVRDDKLSRVEIEIYYSDKLEKWYKDIIESSADYFAYTISPKYMKMNNIPIQDWKRTFLLNVKRWKDISKSKKISSTVARILSTYDTKEIYYLTKGKNRSDAELTILNIVEGILR